MNIYKGASGAGRLIVSTIGAMYSFYV